MIRGPYEVIHYFTGLSTDTKPTDGVSVGDRFFETDSGLWYIYAGSWSVMSSDASATLYGKCSSTMTGSTTSLVIPGLIGFGDDFFNTKYFIQVIKNANSAGNAPELQVRMITDYTSSTGTFTTDAFSVNVEASDEVLVLHESTVLLGRNDNDNVFVSSAVVANADGSVLERLEWIQTAIGSGASQLRVLQSASGTVEETDIIRFQVALMDVDSGAITSANINITSITQTMERSRNGAAYAAISDPVVAFSKSDGIVYMDYEFKAAQWQVGDMYRMSLSGITCTVAGVTAYVPAMVWNNIVSEAEDVTNAVQYLYAVADGGTTSPTKVIDNSILSIIMTKDSGGDTSDFNNSTDSLEAIADAIATVPKVTDVGTLQIATTTENLAQAASTYDLFTGTTQAVVLERFTMAMPNVNVADDATITYITVQTDHATAQVIFNSTTGAKANLTAEAQLSWDGQIYIPAGKKIRLTIAGGAADATTTCTFVAEYRAVVAGGTLVG